MSDLSSFDVTRKWPPADPKAIQLYSRTTPNGVKISIALEELGLPYEAHHVRFEMKEQLSPEFLSLNPNNRIPAIIDPVGPDGAPIGLFESGAILMYLAEKTGRLIPADPRRRWQVIQWLMFQMGGVGPMFGQIGYFHASTAGRAIEDPRPRDRYYGEARRLLGVLETAIGDQDWIVRDYSIADIAICPWLRQLRDSYKAGAEVGWSDFPQVEAWLERFLARPAVQRGLTIPPRD